MRMIFLKILFYPKNQGNLKRPQKKRKVVTKNNDMQNEDYFIVAQ